MASQLIRHRRRRARPSGFGMALTWGMILLALLLGYRLQGRLPPLPDAVPADSAAKVARGDIRITDGDTFRIGAERIRIANIDTPEMPGRARCAYEAEKALAAKARLGELLASGEISITRDGVDRYGRTLATLSVNGRDVGDQLVAEGAAQRWAGHKAEWCKVA